MFRDGPIMAGERASDPMSERRKLAAILAADVVGYSRLAGKDEERTLIRLRSLRSELLDPTIAVYHGRVVKRIGDGILAEFRSVVDATRCAIEIQRGVGDRNAAVEEGRRIELRIGIHLGDVVEEEDGDLMGDGVNIAARLEGFARPGAICLSEDAFRQVRNRVALEVSDLGLARLKHISEPVHVFSVTVDVADSGARRRKVALPRPIIAAGVVIALAGVVAGALLPSRLPFRLSLSALEPAPAPPANAPVAAAISAEHQPDKAISRADVALDAKRYPEALRPYREAAEGGSAEAQTRLGQMLRDGEGGARNLAEAASWFQKAAEQGDAWAQASLGDLYWRGAGVERSYPLSRRWFEKAAAQENPLGQNGLGILYEQGWGVTKDYAEARKWFGLAARQDFAWGAANLGGMYRRGEGVDRDYQEALRWYRLAAEKGNPGGQQGLGLMYLKGLGVDQDVEKAFGLFQLSARQGFDWGEVNLADLARTSDAHRDYAEAFRLYSDAASQGNPAAESGLGILNEQGLGVPVDYGKAFDWYSRSADQNYSWGLVNLGYIYAWGRGIAKDCATARQLFSRGVAAGGDDVSTFLAAHPVCG
jgi:TPR repeat protein/class 3 adenylate cyclase